MKVIITSYMQSTMHCIKSTFCHYDKSRCGWLGYVQIFGVYAGDLHNTARFSYNREYIALRDENYEYLTEILLKDKNATIEN